MYPLLVVADDLQTTSCTVVDDFVAYTHVSIVIAELIFNEGLAGTFTDAVAPSKPRAVAFNCA